MHSLIFKYIVYFPFEKYIGLYLYKSGQSESDLKVSKFYPNAKYLKPTPNEKY